MTMRELRSGKRGSAGRLMAAALEIFNRVGVNAASIHEICRQAGVSIGSAYHHFGSKQGIADALLVEGLRSNTRQLEARLRATSGAEAGIRTVVESLIQWIESNPDWARFIYTVADLGPRAGAGEPLRRVNAEHRAVIEGYFRPYLEAGALRRLPEECYASLILGPVHDYARRFLSGQVATPLSEHAGLFADAAWQVVRTG